jgi:predicted transglutaminase-like cysteine proteinase
MKPALAILIVLLPCRVIAYDMNTQLAGWDNATQLLKSYPVRLHTGHIEHFEAKLDAINRAVNAIPYRNDAETYRDINYWQTPTQLAQYGGECRDYAIAKYHALYALGVADADMAFVAVRIKATGQMHAVLMVKHGGRAYILDNRHAQVFSSMAEYQPLYSINRLGWRVTR